jgi:hypothetical protein
MLTSMTRTLWWTLALLMSLGLGLDACSSRDPVKPTNHSLIMHSLTASPDTLGPGDSTVVTCVATDQDGDTLVYDWACDWRMHIKGQPLPYPIKNNTFNNAETLYLDWAPTQPDSTWMTCEVRDRLGGGAIRALVFRTHP